MSGVLFRIGEYWSDTELGERPIKANLGDLGLYTTVVQRLRGGTPPPDIGATRKTYTNLDGKPWCLDCTTVLY